MSITKEDSEKILEELRIIRMEWQALKSMMLWRANPAVNVPGWRRPLETPSNPMPEPNRIWCNVDPHVPPALTPTSLLPTP